jgi:hypothetical protein
VPLLDPSLSLSRQAPPSTFSSLWVPLARSLSFRVLTSPFSCCLQFVSDPCSAPSVLVLTSPSLCHIQRVSVSYSVSFFPCPDKYLPLLSPESECPLFSHFLFRVLTKPHPLPSPARECPLLSCFLSADCVLTSPSLCRLQEVSASRSVSLFPCRDKSLSLPSPDCVCPSLSRFLSKF